MKNEVNKNDVDLAYNKMRKTAMYKQLPHTQVGKSDTPKETQTRLDMKLMRQRRGLGYEQLKNQIVGKMEKDLKGAMKAQGKKFSDVPRHLGKDHSY